MSTEYRRPCRGTAKNQRGHQDFLEEIEGLHPAFIELGQLGPVFLVKSSAKGAATRANGPPVYSAKADEGAKLRLGRGDDETLD